MPKPLFSFDDLKVNCGNCLFFSAGDIGLSEPSKLQLLSEQAQQGQPIRTDIGACIRVPPTFMTRPGTVSVNTPHGPQSALANLPSPSFPVINKSRKCGEFFPANYEDNGDGSITLLERTVENGQSTVFSRGL